ncbi:MAG: hypothetical protein ABSG07_21665 [Terriglobales bacterium]|jgi:hypothetical protein
MRIMLAILLVSVVVAAQESRVLPNAPSVVQPPASPARCGPWKCWDYPSQSNRRVLASKGYRAYLLTDAAVQAFDDILTKNGIAHQDHKPVRTCVEKNVHPPSPTGGQLVKSGIPEFAAVAAFGFFATKLKMPAWLMFTTETYPVQAHLRDGIEWAENCW